MSDADQSTPQPAQIDRLLQLLADRATEGLDPNDQRELSALSTRFPELDTEVLDRTVAALELSFNLPRQELPDDVYAKALRGADDFFTTMAAGTASAPVEQPPLPVSTPPAEPAAAPAEAARPVTDRAPHATAAPPQPAPVASPEPPASSADPAADYFIAPQKKRGRKKPPAAPAAPGFGHRLGWFAAAAALLIAVIGWWPQLQQRLRSPDLQTTITLEERRAALLRSTDDAIISDWQTGNDRLAAGVDGDVVWSNSAQQGYLRFTGLPANDPAEHQYQLWIIDAERDERYPVDGGVFDAPITDKTLVIPIKPALRVNDPTLFVVTLEPSGGVVVSDRERLLLTAAVQDQ